MGFHRVSPCLDLAAATGALQPVVVLFSRSCLGLLPSLAAVMPATGRCLARGRFASCGHTAR